MILPPSSWSFPRKLDTLNSFQYAYLIWVISFPCLHNQSLHGVWSNFRSLKKLENVYLRYFLVFGRPNKSFLTSLPPTFTCLHPTVILAFSSPNSQPQAHHLYGHHKWMTLRLLTNILLCEQLHFCSQD